MTGEELSRQDFEEVLRIDTRYGGYVAQYECRADPRVGILVSRPTRVWPKTVKILVGRLTFDRGDWSGAAAALASL